MTRRPHPQRVLLLLLLLAAPAITKPAGAAELQPLQAPASAAGVPAAAAGEAAHGGADRPFSLALQASDAQLPPQAGLPAPAAPPRTLRAYWHVFIAFAIAWLLLFLFVVRLHRRFAQLDREMREVVGSR